MSSPVETFFDRLAPSWDEGECHSEQEKRFLLDAVGIRKGDKVLDLACGTGVITGLIHDYSNSDVLGIDLSEEMIKVAKEKYKAHAYARFEKMDFLNATFLDPFDVIVVYNAFPHFLDVEAFARKLHESVKKGGRVAILHSLSRQELSAHHSGAASPVSRDLEAPEIEARKFLGFSPLRFEEGDHHYILLLKKD